MLRSRKIVTFEPVWDDTLIWYERAVGVMVERRTADVTSWAYQAAIHGTTRTPNHPSWNSCEHGGWYFFPWHRYYLAAFEDIVRATIVPLGGPSDWALPYWDYERPGMDALPPAFRAEQKPDGSANNLYTDQRLSYVNEGIGINRILTAVLGPKAKLSSAAGRAEPTFSGTGQALAFPFGFGGGPTPSLPDDEKYSDIEQNIHGTVHVLVGGRPELIPGVPTGWMAQVATSAQDPIFWLHHANIDRMWAEWSSDPLDVNPSEDKWTTQPWTFFRPDATERHETAGALQDTTAASLNYRYDTVDQQPPPADAIDDAMADEPTRGALQPIGWSTPVILSGHETNVQVPVDAATVLAIAPLGADAPTPVRSYLELSDIDVPTVPGILYGVYLHAQGAEPTDDDLAGVASFFTTGRAVPGGRDRQAHRLRYVYDVTDVLDAAGATAVPLIVTFRPVGASQLASALRGVDAGDEPDAPPVSIGRVALLMG